MGADAGASFDGLLVLDKPGGWTSHDVVARVRRLAGMRRVGHAGTLDPMATGVLVLGLGRATRLLGHLALADKDYTATMRLGRTTITDDADGVADGGADASGVTDAGIEAAVAALRGPIQQVPSKVSAIKVEGRRSYDLVRSGAAVDLQPRPVVVSRFEVLAVRRAARDDGPGEFVDVDVAVTCSTGTYVRALVRDVGAALGVGGHLTALRRTRVGPFALDAAAPVDDDLDVGAALVPLDAAVATSFPTVVVPAALVDAVLHGRPVDLDDLPEPGAVLASGTAADGSGQAIGALAADGRALALMEQPAGERRLKPLVVFS
jgi:tRNA pseudouridine55 synthase